MSTWKRLVARARAMDPYRLDALLALVVLADTQVEALVLDLPERTALVAHLVGVWAAAVVALHRRAVWVAFLGAQGLFVFGQSIDDTVTDSLVAPLFVVLAMNVSAAAQVSGRRFWLVPLGAAAGAFTALSVDTYDDDLAGALWALVFFVGATCTGGRLLDSRVRLSRALREKAARAAEEEAAQAERAMLEERTRIAGELHDIIAHALSGMVVQAAAARRLVDTDPARAREAFATVEESGRDALGELRRLLGVLRREDEAPALAPAPSLVHLDALVRRTTLAGLPVQVSVDGDVRALPAALDVTAYRVVQEALTAALELGGAGRATVRVRYRGDGVDLEVADDGRRDAGQQRRLMGMAERVALFGGDLHLARPRDGGHLVRAHLPVAAGAPA